MARRRIGMRQQCHGVLSLFRALFVKTPACMLRFLSETARRACPGQAPFMTEGVMNKGYTESVILVSPRMVLMEPPPSPPHPSPKRERDQRQRASGILVSGSPPRHGDWGRGAGPTTSPQAV